MRKRAYATPIGQLGELRTDRSGQSASGRGGTRGERRGRRRKLEDEGARVLTENLGEGPEHFVHEGLRVQEVRVRAFRRAPE